MRLFHLNRKHKAQPKQVASKYSGLKEDNEEIYRMVIDRLLREMNQQ